MSDKIGQRFTAHETLETTKLGTLVRATDDQLGAPALVLRLSSAARADEATLAAVLADNRKLADCPQALLAYDCGRDDRGAWIAVEATEGCLAEEVLRRRDKLEMAHLVDAGLAMAKASSAAAAADVWIGDLGPHRLWLQGGAVGGKVRTFGYGWWRLLPPVAPGSAAEEFFGAPEYLAAEACKGGALSAASDVYCAATSVWALAAGKPPFHGPQALSVIKRQAAEKPLRLDLVKPALKGVKDLQAVLADALDKDPAKRPAAAAWAQTLQAAAATWGPLPSGDDATVPQRARSLGGATAATDQKREPTTVIQTAAKPAPIAVAAEPPIVASAPAEPAPAVVVVSTPPAVAKPADPGPTAALTPSTAELATKAAQSAPEAAAPAAVGEDDDDGDDDDEPAPTTGAVADSNRRGKKGKKSRRDRDRGGPQPIVGKSAPTPIASPVQKVERAAVDLAKTAEPAKAAEPSKPAEPVKSPAVAGVVVGSAADQPKSVTPAAPTAPSPTAGRTVKTTDRIRIEAMHESAFFSHDDKPEAGKDLHDQGPPVPPPQKVNKLLLGTVAAFAVAMVAVAVYIKVNAPPEPPPVPPEGSEIAAPAPTPEPAPVPTPEPAPTPAVPAAEVAAPPPAPDAASAGPEVAAEVAETPSDQAARLVDEGQALLRAGTLDKALEKAKEAQTLNPGNALALALQKQVEQAQADAAAGAAAAAAKAEADNKVAAEAEAKKKAADEAAAKQAAAEAEKAEAERKKAEDKAAKQADADRKKQEEQAAREQAAKKKSEAEANKADEARKKKEEAAAKKAEEERRKADEERKKAAEAEKARKADETRKKKEEAAAKKEVAKPPKVEKADKPPPPPVAEANDAQKEAARFAALAQKATTAKLKVLYLRKAVDRDPANGKFKQMLKDAEAELATQPH